MDAIQGALSQVGNLSVDHNESVEVTVTKQPIIETAQSSLSKVVDVFTDPSKTNQLPELMSRAWIDSPMKPSSAWSLNNRFIMYLMGTADARGFRQWQEVKRYVRKGTHAFYILAPLTYMMKTPKLDSEGNEIMGEFDERKIVRGFKGIPVFRLEDTDGEPLPVYEPRTVPPLAKVAESWGLKVRYERLPGEYGHLNPNTGEIVLGTEGYSVFFHELAHEAQNRLGMLKGANIDDVEASAELTAAALTVLYGGQLDRFSLNYIKRNTDSRTEEQLGRAIFRLIAQVEAMLAEIMGGIEKEEAKE